MHPCTHAPMHPFFKTPTLQSLQDGSGREADSIVLAGEMKFLFLLLGSLSDFGINHYKKYKVQFTRYKGKYKVQFTRYMLLALIHVVLCSLFFVLNFTWGLPCQKEDDEVCSQS